MRDYLDDFCSIYLNDILVFSKDSLKQYKEYVCKVLDKFKEAGLHLNINKCEFEIVSIKYLNFIIEAEKDIYMDSDKVKVIREWKIFITVKRIKNFFGFANFY